jgi:hypothetical protein
VRERLLVAMLMLLFGFILTAFVYDLTFSAGSASQDTQNICEGDQAVPNDAVDDFRGPALVPVDVNVNAGRPFTTNVPVKVPQQQGCGAFSSEPTFRVSDFLSSWQFYANWLVWSLPLLGIAHLISNRYAHSRH